MRKTILAFVLVCLFTPLQIERADAAGCKAGCSAAKKACGYVLKDHDIGCEIVCQDQYDLDLDADAFAVCRDACRTDAMAAKDACAADYEACRVACDDAPEPSCANICGGDLDVCADAVYADALACFQTNAPAGNGGALVACGVQGASDLAICANAFTSCMSLPCSSVCGDSTLQYGEECDDGDLDDGDGCSGTCLWENSDGDTILDDGDYDTVPGNNPCPSGVTAACDDNCPTVDNEDQLDTDGDLVGDVCDFNCTGSGAGSDISGTVYLNNVGGTVVPGTEVSACKTGTACCAYATSDGAGTYQFLSLEDGTYDIVAYPPGTLLAATIAPIAVTAPQVVVNAHIVVTGPQPLPGHVQITNNGFLAGIPFVIPSQPITLSVTACIGASVTYTVAQLGASLDSGSLSDGNADGVFEYTIPASTLVYDPSYPLEFTITISLCGGAPDGTSTFNAYIDPSGFTRYITGDAAPGSTVTLLHAASPFGPWTVVPDGSVIMSPQNRTNPDVSDAAGHFGWDVLSGYYKVEATISGCVVESEALTIPPAVTDLDLVFDCPCIAGPLNDCRAATDGKLSLKDDAGNDAKDAFSWKWSGGESTSVLEYGTPQSTTTYGVCVYADSSVPLLTLDIPASATDWSSVGSDGSKGYKYKDKAGSSSGVQKVSLSTSSANKSKIQVKAKGLALPDPTLGGLATPIIVQLQASEGGVCFESLFDTAGVIDNSPSRLKAKVP